MLVIFDKVDVRVDRANHNVDNYIMGTRLKEFPSSVVVLCFFRRFDSLFVNYNH